MRKVESLSIRYVGYKEPENADEIELEVLGLETTICAARQRIAILRQSLQLRELMKNSVVEDTKNEETVQEARDVEELKV
ncbi:MAG TPA: hypothetical protein ENH99_00365 [Candidatus Pacearchaeota archaeon]|nr:hypothetical protein [Candidatus Pacearchaeota archaeon]